MTQDDLCGSSRRGSDSTGAVRRSDRDTNLWGNRQGKRGRWISRRAFAFCRIPG